MNDKQRAVFDKAQKDLALLNAIIGGQNIDFHFRLRGLTKEQAECLFHVILAVVETLGGQLVGGPVYDVPDDQYLPE